MKEQEKSIDSLLKLVRDFGPDVLFTDKALGFTKGALAMLKLNARACAATVRLPRLRDKIPGHIREDILLQSVNLIEVIGRCSFVIILFENGHADQTDTELKKVFASMYMNACDRQDDLQKLCKLTVDTYAEPGYLTSFNMIPDKEF